MAAESISVEERLGIDIKSSCSNELDMVTNYGKGKRYPGAPTCVVNGKTIEALVTCSPKGGITSNILVDILKHIDNLNIWENRSTHLHPCLLLDGHGSRLELPFLEYINDQEHLWKCCIGLPNATQLWQVGDSSEQNGAYKMSCYAAKQDIVQTKRRAGMFNTNLLRTDIVPIVNYAWEKSFAVVQNNCNAISERGWNPLNRNLLTHPEVISYRLSTEHYLQSPTHSSIISITMSTSNRSMESSQQQSQVSSNEISTNSQVDIQDLNLERGYAGTVITDILQDALKSQQCLANLEQRKVTGKTLYDAHDEGKRLTAGLMFDHDKVMLDLDVLGLVKEKNDRKYELAVVKAVKVLIDFRKRQHKINNMIDEGLLTLPTSQLKSDDLKILLQWKKRKGDKALSSIKVVDVRTMWDEFKVRNHQSEEEYMKYKDVFVVFEKETGKELTYDMLKEFALEYEHEQNGNPGNEGTHVVV